MEPGPVIRSPPAERLLLVLTPAVALTVVALGLRLGASEALVAAEVRGAPRSGAGTGLAWQILVYREEGAAREAVVGLELDVVARAGGASASFHGRTNGDGVAEARLDLPASQAAWLQVRAGQTILAEGECDARPPQPPPNPVSGWLSYARREGPIAIDVAALGHRVAPGFPAELWVRATNAATNAPLGGVAIELANDSGLARIGRGSVETDPLGWATITATPVGLAVVATLRARSRDAREGEWTGGLYMSPGAARIATRRRWEPGVGPELLIVAPTTWGTAYIEVDDHLGRAWAATFAPVAQQDGTSSASVHAPNLSPGLYWAVASEDPAGAATLSAGTIVRPFFVASADEAAFAFGTDREACVAPPDPRETSNALSACLTLSATAPVPRWRALDGFAQARAVYRKTRGRGRAVALGAIAAAMVLEGMLLLRAARTGPINATAAAARTDRFARVAVAILVGLLGLALLAAFIARASGD
jgi:hypothetical protein